MLYVSLGCLQNQILIEAQLVAVRYILACLLMNPHCQNSGRKFFSGRQCLDPGGGMNSSPSLKASFEG